MYAVLPCYPSDWEGDADNPRVVLDVLRVIGDRDGEGWQAFEPVFDADPIYRSPTWTRDATDWRTRREIDGTDRYYFVDADPVANVLIRRIVRAVSHPYADDRYRGDNYTGRKQQRWRLLIA